jgi:ADP-ribosylglycohydrolase
MNGGGSGQGSAPISTIIAIEASDAAARGLPPIGMRLDRAGTAIGFTLLPDASCFLAGSGPPGAPLGFRVCVTRETTCDAAAVERELRASLSYEREVEVTEHATVTVAGAARPAVVAITRGWREVTWLGTIVPTNRGAVFILAAATYAPGRRASAADLMAARDLAPLFRTLVVEGALSQAMSTTAATRMAFELASGEASDARPQPPKQVKVDGWEQALSQRASLRRALGALLGLAVGDALGTTNEFKALDAPAFPELATGPLDDIVGSGPFKLRAGEVTDDTQMAAALAELFWKSNQISNGVLSVRYLAWQKVAFDVGVQIGQALDLVARGTYPERAGREAWEARNRFPAGNGSLMRTAVIGTLLAAMPPEVRRTAAFIDSAITHFDPRCQLACAAFNAAIAHALTSRPSPASMLRAAADELHAAAEALRAHYTDLRAEIDAAEAALASDLAAARDDDPQLYGDELHLHRGAGFVRVAFRLAFWELMHAPDYGAAVIDVANRGGDADTNAAITGALLGAFHGVDAIPSAWIDKVLTAPALVAEERELHPRTFLRALTKGFAGDRDPRTIAALVPYVAIASPELAPAGPAVRADGSVTLATAAYPLRSRLALPLLRDLLTHASHMPGFEHVTADQVVLAGDPEGLRVGSIDPPRPRTPDELARMPRTLLCAPPELVAGYGIAPAVTASYNACALWAFALRRHGQYDPASERPMGRAIQLPAMIPQPIANAVLTALNPDARARVPASFILTLIDFAGRS